MSGGRKSRDKGNRRERAINKFLQSRGFASERIPLSGSAADLAEKGLVVNATNFDRLAHCCKNEDTDMWPGNTVTLYTELVSFKGKTGPAVRVKAPAKPSTPVNADPRPEPPLNDAIPF
jgi:hypothetical protein